MWLSTILQLALMASAPNQKLQGRWDLTVETPNGRASSWLEIELSGIDALVGRFVGPVGSARPISRIVADGDSLHFELPRQWERGSGPLIVDGRLDGDRLSGRMVLPNGKTANWPGTRAPLLHPGAS